MIDIIENKFTNNEIGLLIIETNAIRNHSRKEATLESYCDICKNHILECGDKFRFSNKETKKEVL